LTLMNGNLVDTNVIVKMLNGDLEAVEIFESLDEVFVSVITAGELYYGASKSARNQENKKLFEDFLSEYPIIEISEGIGCVYGEVKAGLVKIGVNIPENDLWIASTALEKNMTLVSFDRHFQNIKRLKLYEIKSV
jgi:tRNA(fMet)-specific endonuclease VapC